MASRNFFTDRFGRQTIIQVPNAPILGWAAFGAASLMALTPKNSELLKTLSKSCLVLWALGETFRGRSGFRRTVGAVTLWSQLARANGTAGS